MDNNIYISGYTTPSIEEIDEELYNEKINLAEDNYDTYNFLDTFHTDQFETFFRLNISTIMTFTPRDLIIVCRLLIMKIYQYYKYQITPAPIFVDFNDIMLFFDFVKFLEYDNVSFLRDLCSELNLLVVDITKLKKLSNVGESKIINHIDNLLDRYKYNLYICNYLMNQTKIEIIKWIDESFIKNKSDILSDLN